jgi:hypothetical protein
MDITKTIDFDINSAPFKVNISEVGKYYSRRDSRVAIVLDM